MTKLLSQKRGLIMGVANDKSIAWAIAKKAHENGASLAFTYQGEILEKRIKPLAEEIGSSVVIPCDVSNDESLEATFKHLKNEIGTLDFIIHSIAYATRDALKGRYVDTQRDHFKQALDISCYSLAAVCKYAEPLLNPGGSILTMTYYGSERVIPNYNVMGVAKAALEASVRYLAYDLGEKGIRVNAISAGPIKTLAASAIGDFNSFLNTAKKNSPLRENVTQEDVANSSLYFLSDLSKHVTGEIHYVDAGYNIMGIGGKTNES
jgi:enoyl-[acyl-carrier protein] reductase I